MKEKITATSNKDNPNFDDGYLWHNIWFINSIEHAMNDMLGGMLTKGEPMPLTDILRFFGIPLTFKSSLYEYIAGEHYLRIKILNESEFMNNEAEELYLEFNTDECYYRFEND